MTVRQAIAHSFLNLLIITAGLALAIIKGWSQDGPSLLHVTAFVMISMGVLALSISLTRIIIPVNTNFGYATLFSGRQYQEFKKTAGKRSARLINTTYLTLFFLLFPLTAYVYENTRNRYERYHLDTYGKVLKVVIKATEYAPNSRQYGLFEYSLNQKTYHDKLPTHLYKGDSALIIVSEQKPEIVAWLSAYQAASDHK